MQWNRFVNSNTINTFLLILIGVALGYFIYREINNEPIIINPAPSDDIEQLRIESDSLQVVIDSMYRKLLRYQQINNKLIQNHFNDLNQLKNALQKSDSISPVDDPYILLESIRRISAINPPNLQSSN